MQRELVENTSDEGSDYSHGESQLDCPCDASASSKQLQHYSKEKPWEIKTGACSRPIDEKTWQKITADLQANFVVWNRTSITNNTVQQKNNLIDAWYRHEDRSYSHGAKDASKRWLNTVRKRLKEANN